MKKKLLQINSIVNSGSTGRIAEEIGNVAISNNWDSYIAYARNENISQSHKVKIGNKLDIFYHVLITRLFDRHGLASNKATQKLICGIDQIKPDIIHLHNIHGYYLNYKLLFEYFAKQNIPIIWTLHDCWPMTGHCAYFDFIKCDKWQFACNNCIQKQKYPKSLFMDRSRKNYELKKHIFTLPKNIFIVPVSNWLEKIVKKSYLGIYPTKVINNGVDTTVFTNYSAIDSKVRLKYHIPENAFMVLGVANVWNDRKGLNDFIELNNKINSNVIIVLIGLTKTQKKKLPLGIIGIERTQSIHELASFYRAADLFVNPTWEDNFPTTNIEALACGCPIVTYNTGGSIEAVTPETGFIVPKGDINAVLYCIETVRINGKGFYNSNCRERALKNYDKYLQFGEYIKLYNQCLMGKFY